MAGRQPANQQAKTRRASSVNSAMNVLPPFFLRGIHQATSVTAGACRVLTSSVIHAVQAKESEKDHNQRPLSSRRVPAWCGELRDLASLSSQRLEMSSPASIQQPLASAAGQAAAEKGSAANSTHVVVAAADLPSAYGAAAAMS